MILVGYREKTVSLFHPDGLVLWKDKLLGLAACSKPFLTCVNKQCCNPQVFADLFDPVIKDRHNGYDPKTMKHPTDLDSSKVEDFSLGFEAEKIISSIWQWILYSECNTQYRCLVQITSGIFDDKYVLSSRVRTGRSIRGLSLPPACTRAERREVERVVVQALSGLKGDLSGKYYSLTEMSEKDQQQLIDVRPVECYI